MAHQGVDSEGFETEVATYPKAVVDFFFVEWERRQYEKALIISVLFPGGGWKLNVEINFILFIFPLLDVLRRDDEAESGIILFHIHIHLHLFIHMFCSFILAFLRNISRLVQLSLSKL